MRQREHEAPIEHIHTSEEIDDSSQLYALTRRGFLDAVYNRIHVVNFYPTTLHRARIFALPNQLDRNGRIKVALAINPEFSKESQAQSLVHEMIHVDRNSWEKYKGLISISDEFYQIEAEEEDITEKAANTFFNTHKSLSVRALYHVWLRRKALNED